MDTTRVMSPEGARGERKHDEKVDPCFTLPPAPDRARVYTYIYEWVYIELGADVFFLSCTLFFISIFFHRMARMERKDAFEDN